MKSVTLVIDESTDARLKALAQRCDTTPGEFVDFLCAALDGETLQRVIQRAIRAASSLPSLELRRCQNGALRSDGGLPVMLARLPSL